MPQPPSPNPHNNPAKPTPTQRFSKHPANSPLHPFLHAVRQLFNLIRLLDHVHRQDILIRLVHIRLQLGSQRQQLVGIGHQFLLPLRAPRPRLLLLHLRIGRPKVRKPASRRWYHRILSRLLRRTRLCPLAPAQRSRKQCYRQNRPNHNESKRFHTPPNPIVKTRPPPAFPSELHLTI